MNVSELMSHDLLTTQADARLAPVVELMMRRGLGELPVVDRDRALLGLLTRLDLLNPPAPGGDSAEEFLGQRQLLGGVRCELDQGFHLDVDSSVRVADVMSRRPVAVTPNTRAERAAALMAEHQLTSLPVISADGVLLGTVSAIDLVRQRS